MKRIATVQPRATSLQDGDMNNAKPLLLLTARVSFLTAIVLLIANIILWSKYSDVCDLFLSSAPVVGGSYARTCKDEAQIKHARELLERSIEDARFKGWDDYILWATPVKHKFYRKALEAFEKQVLLENHLDRRRHDTDTTTDEDITPANRISTTSYSVDKGCL